MTPTHMKKTILVIAAVLFLFSGIAWAETIKQRMTKRLPAISALKAKGVIGETNNGYLGFVTGNRPQSAQAVVAAENKDRKAIYRQIAKSNNVSLELVEKRRARALADRAKKGRFIQSPGGAWVKK